MFVQYIAEFSYFLKVDNWDILYIFSKLYEKFEDNLQNWQIFFLFRLVVLNKGFFSPREEFSEFFCD